MGHITVSSAKLGVVSPANPFRTLVTPGMQKVGARFNSERQLITEEVKLLEPLNGHRLDHAWPV